MFFKVIVKILIVYGTLDDLKTLESIPSMISGSTICALGDAAAMPVESFIKHYRSEFLQYIKNQTVDPIDKNNFAEISDKEFVLNRK